LKDEYFFLAIDSVCGVGSGVVLVWRRGGAVMID